MDSGIRAPKPLTKKEFFDWCAGREIGGTGSVGRAIHVSSQTIRNWKKKGDDDLLPSWLPYAVAAREAADAGAVPEDHLRPMTVTRLSRWSSRNGFSTLELIGDVFGISRQGVHNWYSRHSFPRWLALGCVGYDVLNGHYAKESSTAA